MLNLNPRSISLQIVICLLLLEGTVRAVPPAPGRSRNSLDIKSTAGRYRPQKPTVSPYLALSPGGIGNLAAVNFFNIIQPQIVQQQVNQQNRAALGQIQREFDTVAAETAELEDSSRRRPQAAYQTQHKYFNVQLNQTGNPNFAGQR